jgi:DNA polymerase-3 subunit gamma/tau
MLLSQQAQLVRLDQRRAVVQVAGNWMAMVQSRLPLLEAAVTKALGSPRQLVLEGGGEHAPPPSKAPLAAPVVAVVAAPAPAQAPAPAPQPAPKPETEAVAEAVMAVSAAKPPPSPAPLDEKARRLAEFFNGEVVELDGPLEDTPTNDAAA